MDYGRTRLSQYVESIFMYICSTQSVCSTIAHLSAARVKCVVCDACREGPMINTILAATKRINPESNWTTNKCSRRQPRTHVEPVRAAAMFLDAAQVFRGAARVVNWCIFYVCQLVKPNKLEVRYDLANVEELWSMKHTGCKQATCLTQTHAHAHTCGTHVLQTLRNFQLLLDARVLYGFLGKRRNEIQTSVPLVKALFEFVDRWSV